MELTRLKRAYRRDAMIALGACVAIALAVILAVGRIHPGLDHLRAEPQSGDTYAMAASTGGAAAAGARADREASVSGGLPQELVEHYAPELKYLGKPYPEDVRRPVLADLVPQAVGAELVSAHDRELRIAPERPLWEEVRQALGALFSGGEEEGVMVIRPGDVSRMAVADWQCAWIQEYRDADATGDSKRVKAAAKTLKEMGKDPHGKIKKLLAGYEQVYPNVVEPMLDGDMAPADSHLADSCPRVDFT